MGYGQINGFRASVSSPFYWYDLQNEQTTSLLIRPFCFMDANAYHEQGLNAEQALQELIYYHNIIREVNGEMITLWHNNFLGTANEFRGWRETYERFIETVATTK